MAIDKNVRVLVVDDREPMLKIAEIQLTHLGFGNIETALNGEEALAKLEKGGAAVILADWRMEPMSGIQLLRTVKASEALRGIPFIMMTADSNPDHVHEAKEAGAEGYIVKPFTTETLMVKLGSVLGAG